MSTHCVKVVRLGKARDHEEADDLVLYDVEGWQVITRRHMFKEGDKAVYIPPDYMVPTNAPEFHFLHKEGQTYHRLKAIRLRGLLSYGLLIPVPDRLSESPVGTDVMADLDIRRYVPFTETQSDSGLPRDAHPKIPTPTYNVETYYTHLHEIENGEKVIVTEKVHGANARYLYYDGVFYVGSRTRWLSPSGNHMWARIAQQYPQIEKWCRDNPGTILYGEVYGNVQSLRYSAIGGEIWFVAFDAEGWNQLDLKQSVDVYDIPFVPVVYEGPFTYGLVIAMAERNSFLAARHGEVQMMEGIVIRPEQRRISPEFGPVRLKHISDRYWEKSDRIN